MHAFTLLFLVALALASFTKLWLALRQMRHVAAHRDRVPAPFAGEVSLESHRKAADYERAKTRLGMIHVLLDAGVLLAFTLGGGLQALDDWLGALLAPGLWRGTALILGVVLIASVVEIPLNAYRVFVIEMRFGFNKTGPGLFVADLLKQAALALALGVPLLLGVLWLMARAGANWWLYVWLTWMGFNLLVLALYPTFIAPLFNKFTPLDDAALKSRIEGFLQKCGFRAEGLFVMDGSRRSGHGNAYFTGFGKGKRIVFFDTLLTQLDDDEIEAVLAHEVGHFKRHHLFKRLAWMFAASLLFLWLLAWLMDKPWFFHGLHVHNQSTAMALILFFMVVPVFGFLLQPLASRYSRKHEFEADRYAARQSGAGDLIRALVKLYKDNASTLTPDPLHSAVYDSHPPAARRIAQLREAMHNG